MPYVRGAVGQGSPPGAAAFVIIPAMTGFDLETTGIDVEADRIVTAAVTNVRPGEPPVEFHSMCDPGIEIPAGAAEVHGITTERARAEGGDRAKLVEKVSELLALSISAGIPIVGCNLAYDLTLFDRERRRLGMTSLAEFVGLNEVGPIIDVLVIDKYVDQYRPGSRKLSALCEHYGVNLDGAHDAAHDTLAACRVAFKLMRRAQAPRDWLRTEYGKCRDKTGQPLQSWRINKIIERFGELSGMDMWELHWAQAGWRATQAKSLEAHLRRTDDGAKVDPWWPVRPYGEVEPTADAVDDKGALFPKDEARV
jgi:DNA polymerase-3 subunit epsilon